MITLFSFALWLLSLRSITSDVVQFELEVKFSDSDRSKYLAVDLTTSESFVFDYRAFNKSHVDAFDPSASKTFKKISDSFKASYFTPANSQNMTVQGFLGADVINTTGKVLIGDFAVVNWADGKGVLNSIDGSEKAGRVGLSRAKATHVDLRSAIFAAQKEKNLCLAIFRFDDEILTAVKFGKPYYEPEEVITQFKAADNNNGHWQVPVTSVEAGGYKYQVGTPGILSTSTDQIVFPTPIFNSVVRALKATLDKALNAYVVDCSNKEILKIGVNSKLFEIIPASYTKQVGQKCVLRISPTAQKAIVLGGPYFMYNGVCLNYADFTVTLYKPEDYNLKKLSNMNQSQRRRGIQNIRRVKVA
ncbi:unnamed protein product [Bursaphelenchus xylophilus]|uniref:(pine wood nematode) hypothetical protein n=1 Tax=Bursaphelenchus xylophilus TaxID=6326 RepID=A0A1I7SR23_BURXY|nr:unnamed protein product [Bursaphelenchus xylophilus]CAG9110724.1 unnamed protein product [Bursaphelenchus xylophilus]